MATKTFLLMLFGALICVTNARGLAMERNNAADEQKTFFHHHFPPYGCGLDFGGSFGGDKGPGLGGVRAGFGSGSAEYLGGGSGCGAEAGGGLGSSIRDLGTGNGLGGNSGFTGRNRGANASGDFDGGFH